MAREKRKDELEMEKKGQQRHFHCFLFILSLEERGRVKEWGQRSPGKERKETKRNCHYFIFFPL